MQEVLSGWYLWLKTIHILAVIAWMAGLLLLPRYFVLHSQVEPSDPTSDKLITMESKLRKIIIAPSMIATWLFGILLAVSIPDIMSQGWFHVKLTMVILLSAYHGYLVRLAKEFKRGERKHGHKFYRGINEIPFVLAIIIVAMVVLKPF